MAEQGASKSQKKPPRFNWLVFLVVLAILGAGTWGAGSAWPEASKDTRWSYYAGRAIGLLFLAGLVCWIDLWNRRRKYQRCLLTDGTSK